MDKTNNDKEMSTLYLNMYTDCKKFKTQQENDKNTTKKINCNEYYDKYIFFQEKCKDKIQ